MSRQPRIALASLAAGVLVLAMTAGTRADSPVTVRVSAQGNPWAAGQQVPIVDGTAPAEIAVPEGHTFVSFPLVTGSWSNSSLRFSADGEHPAAHTDFDCGGPPPCTLVASNGLSGLADASRFWYLTGVFIGVGVPGGSPPPSIDFSSRHEFMFQEPALDQAFFIGDGRTSDGVIQEFRVPPGATRLLLGMVDICRPGEVASCYYDNDGSLEVAASWGPPDTATWPSPGPLRDNNWLLVVALGAGTLLTVLRVRPR